MHKDMTLGYAIRICAYECVQTFVQRQMVEKDRKAWMAHSCLSKSKQEMRITLQGSISRLPGMPGTSADTATELVPCASLLDLMKQIDVSNTRGKLQIDFFSLDVEGSEIGVLESIDWATINVDVFLIENSDGIRGTTRSYMASKGYVFIDRIEIDDLYISTTAPPYLLRTFDTLSFSHELELIRDVQTIGPWHMQLSLIFSNLTCDELRRLNIRYSMASIRPSPSEDDRVMGGYAMTDYSNYLMRRYFEIHTGSGWHKTIEKATKMDKQDPWLPDCCFFQIQVWDEWGLLRSISWEQEQLSDTGTVASLLDGAEQPKLMITVTQPRLASGRCEE